MIRRSLRWRLVLAAAGTILAALGLSAAGLALLFDRHVERVAVAALEGRALALAAMVEPSPEGAGFRPAAADPMYDRPFSGQYWQLQLGDGLRRSRSLWDAELAFAADPPPPGATRVRTIPGPRGEPLLAVERRLTVGQGRVPLRLLVAMDRADLTRARQGFLGDLMPYLAVLGAFLMAASWVQVTVGLRPLRQVGARVASLASGARPRIGQDLPVEVIPLATEIDSLLDARDRELARARHRAGDLAHGFKTPLQALLGDAGQLRDRGQDDIARSIETVVAAMRRLVDRELARARIQSGRAPSSADPAAVLRKIVAVLCRMPRGAALDWQVIAAPGLWARIDPDDLTEALGALMENAMRHAETRVEARVHVIGGQVAVTIRDDGPGAPDGQLARIVQRGVRLDEGGGGQGIGLAIAAEIADAAQGTLSMRNAGPGLEVEMRLARAPAPAAG